MLVIVVIAAAVAAAIAYWVMTMPDRRTPGEKMDDAIGDINHGFDKASHDLQYQTTGQKLGDKIKGWTGGK